MKRKVIKQGPTTLMISLPAKWTKKFSIQRGDLIDLEEIDHTLKLTTEKEVEVSPIELNADGLDSRHIKRYLQAMYQSGYDEIKLRYHEPKLVPEIQEYISKVLIGYEVIDQQERSLTIRSISKSIDEEFDQILRRAFLVTKQLGENSLEAIKVGDFKALKDISILEDTNDKLVNFCLRVLNKKGYKKYSKTSFVYCILWQLEKIADGYKSICEHLMGNGKEKISKEVLALYERNNRLFASYYELFYSFSPASLMKQTSMNCKAIDEAVLLQSDPKMKPDVVINHLSVMASDMNNMLGPLVGMNI